MEIQLWLNNVSKHIELEEHMFEQQRTLITTATELKIDGILIWCKYCLKENRPLDPPNSKELTTSLWEKIVCPKLYNFDELKSSQVEATKRNCLEMNLRLPLSNRTCYSTIARFSQDILQGVRVQFESFIFNIVFRFDSYQLN